MTRLTLGDASAWRAEGHWTRLDAATADLDGPFAALSLEALAWNAARMRERAGAKRLRLATKSVRCRAVAEAVLALPGWHGVLAATLPEALRLVETIDDAVVGYPTAHRGALRALAADDRARAAVTLMVDDLEQLDAIDAVVPGHAELRVAIELDASWTTRLLRVGARRSPVRTPAQAARLAAAIDARAGFRLVGLMAYEGQIAGVPSARRRGLTPAALIREVQRRSAAELLDRRAATVEAVARIAELEFVNGGGTGSLETTAAEEAVTEIAAGSGLYGPHLFDGYRDFEVAPALAFALPVVRRPGPGCVAAFGGGWIASGAHGRDRLPLPVWPEGLRLDPVEGAGEVQTPLLGAAADGLRVGDRVWFRHAKAGEPLERVDELHVVSGGAVVDTVPTYRGEGLVLG